MPLSDLLKQKLEKNDVVGAAEMLKDWHPITLSNLLLAVQAARTLHSPTKLWTQYENAVRALGWTEGVIVSGALAPETYPEAAISVIEMAVDFNTGE